MRFQAKEHLHLQNSLFHFKPEIFSFWFISMFCYVSKCRYLYPWEYGRYQPLVSNESDSLFWEPKFVSHFSGIERTGKPLRKSVVERTLAQKISRIAAGIPFLFCLRNVQAINISEMMIQFMKYCPFVQSSLTEVSPILEIGSDPSVANLSTVELYFHPSHAVILC
jgi:hypothetical protein